MNVNIFATLLSMPLCTNNQQYARCWHSASLTRFAVKQHNRASPFRFSIALCLVVLRRQASPPRFAVALRLCASSSRFVVAHRRQPSTSCSNTLCRHCALLLVRPVWREGDYLTQCGVREESDDKQQLPSIINLPRYATAWGRKEKHCRQSCYITCGGSKTSSIKLWS